MHPYGDITEVDSALRSLISREGGPFIAELPLQTGTREIRFSHLFSGEAQSYTAAPPPAPKITEAVLVQSQPGIADRVTKLESELAQLRSEVAALKNALGS